MYSILYSALTIVGVHVVGNTVKGYLEDPETQDLLCSSWQVTKETINEVLEYFTKTGE